MLRFKPLAPVALAFLLAAAVLALMFPSMQRDSEERAIQAVEPIVVKAREDELQHIVQAGSTVLAHFCDLDLKVPGSLREGLDLLRIMDYGEEAADNYFFVYSLDGVNVMHPRQPKLQGTNVLKDHRDPLVRSAIEKLLYQAKSGGGLVKYKWLRPTTTKVESKLGYVKVVPGCNLMIGTGLYMDHLEMAKDAIRFETKQQFSNLSQGLFYVMMGALLLVGVVVLVVNLHEQRTANGKLRAMAQKVVQSQELERTRVARELHDGVTQSLASVKYIFEAADIQLDRGKTEAASGALKEGIAQVIGAMVDVRRISHDLYPTILDDQGLGMALKQLAREFGTRTGIPVIAAIADLPVLQREAAKSLYRFVQQALGNIEAHAQAREIKISLWYNRGIKLQVQDNGIGFDVPQTIQQSRDGLGLTNMRERIEMLGGRFEIQSEPGLTALTAYLPAESIQSD